MQLSTITEDLPFIEFSLFIENNQSLLEDAFINRIDTNKLSKLLNSNLKLPLWIDYNEIAADAESFQGQLDLLGHSNEPVLLIKPGDSALVLLFKFKKHEAHEDMYYGKDQKYLIEKCLIGRLSNFVNNEQQEMVNYEKYFQICKNQMLKINYLNNELMKHNFDAEKFFTSLFNYFLKNEISPKAKISLSDSTLDYLKSSDLEFSEIERIAIGAYKTALELSPSSTDIRIKRYFLPEPGPNKLNKTVSTDTNAELLKPKTVFNPVKSPELQLKPKSNNTKLEKTMALLDRYELAVKKLIEDKLPIMGKNIARVCIPEISAPALTDSINKHTDRIIECLKTYPDKWLLLKDNYQPVLKLAY